MASMNEIFAWWPLIVGLPAGVFFGLAIGWIVGNLYDD